MIFRGRDRNKFVDGTPNVQIETKKLRAFEENDRNRRRNSIHSQRSKHLR